MPCRFRAFMAPPSMAASAPGAKAREPVTRDRLRIEVKAIFFIFRFMGDTSFCFVHSFLSVAGAVPFDAFSYPWEALNKLNHQKKLRAFQSGLSAVYCFRRLTYLLELRVES
jgi:hypothetical protein